MKCGRCRKTITAAEMKTVEIEKVNGRVKAAYHRRCAHALKRKQQLITDGRHNVPNIHEFTATRQNADDLTVEAKARRERAEAELEELRAMAVADEVTVPETFEQDGETVSLDDLILSKEQDLALARRQEEIAAQSILEERPEGWADNRDPATKDI